MQEGKKETTDKLNWSLLPMASLEGVVRVFEKGAIKYKGSMTWLPGIPYSKLHAAIIRHCFAWFWKGEDIDEESGESHLCHIIANCMMLCSFLDNKEFDDRE